MFLDDMNMKDSPLVRSIPLLITKTKPTSLIFLVFFLWGHSDAMVIKRRLSGLDILRYMTTFLTT
jgi:hypothetical protein